MVDALRNDSIDCEQGAALMADKKATVDRRIAELKDISSLLGREQQRLEQSAARQRQQRRCLG